MHILEAANRDGELRRISGLAIPIPQAPLCTSLKPLAAQTCLLTSLWCWKRVVCCKNPSWWNASGSYDCRCREDRTSPTLCKFYPAINRTISLLMHLYECIKLILSSYQKKYITDSLRGRQSALLRSAWRTIVHQNGTLLTWVRHIWSLRGLMSASLPVHLRVLLCLAPASRTKSRLPSYSRHDHCLSPTRQAEDICQQLLRQYPELSDTINAHLAVLKEVKKPFLPGGPMGEFEAVDAEFRRERTRTRSMWVFKPDFVCMCVLGTCFFCNF